MRSHIVSFALAVVVASSGGAFAQSLTCPPATTAGSQPCEVFHYHVAMYKPDTRLFAEFDATDQFASQAACERAREAAVKHSLAIVDYMKRVRNDNQFEGDRFGACHCDATIDRGSTNYRTDAQRAAQRRQMEDIRERVRERLLDAGLTSDNELVRPQPIAPSMLGGPKLVPIPQPSVVTAAYNAGDLRIPKANDVAPTTVAGADLPLVDATQPAGAAPTAVVAATTTPAPAPVAPAPAPAPTPAMQQPLQTVVVEPPPAPLPAPAPEPVAETPAPQPAPAPAPVEAAEAATPAEDVAEAFIAYETQRIDKVLEASNAIADDNLRAKILEECQRRIQLLSNLRPIIQASGVRSRIAAAVVGAQEETQRLALVAKLFGRDMPKHWAPKDAADVLLDATPELDTDFDKALNDKSGRFTDQQKRRALYLMLTRSQPTEAQQLWLASVIDGFLQGT